MTNTIGERAVWPYAHWKLTSGSILWVAQNIRMGIVNVNADGTVPVSFFGPAEADEPVSATLRLNEPVRHAHVTITVVEEQLTEKPRWIRIHAQSDRGPTSPVTVTVPYSQTVRVGAAQLSFDMDNSSDASGPVDLTVESAGCTTTISLTQGQSSTVGGLQVTLDRVVASSHGVPPSITITAAMG